MNKIKNLKKGMLIAIVLLVAIIYGLFMYSEKMNKIAVNGELTTISEDVIEVKNYVELKNAINQASNGEKVKIKLSNNIESNAVVSITEEKNIQLDLNSYTISASSNRVITNKGKLEIIDNSSDKNGTITGEVNGIGNDGTVTIIQGTITGKNNGIFNSSTGNITIEGGTIIGADNGIENYAIATINNGIITGENNGIFNGKSGELKIEDGEIIGNTKYGINNSGTLTITQGVIRGKNNGLLNSSTGNFTIQGGEITGENNGIENYAIATINNGIITGENTGIFNGKFGELKIEDGEITGNNSDGIENKGTLTLGEDEGEKPSVTSPRILGSKYGINNEGTFSFYGGRIVFHGEGANDKETFDPQIHGDITKVPNGYEPTRIKDESDKIEEDEEGKAMVLLPERSSYIVVRYLYNVTMEALLDEVRIPGILYQECDLAEYEETIKGYTVIKKPEPLNVTFKDELQTFDYVYGKNTKVIVNHIDINNPESILASEEIAGFVGDEYETKPRSFDGYVQTTDKRYLTINASGKMTEETITVNYYYEHIKTNNQSKDEQDNTPKTGTTEIIIYMLPVVFISAFGIIALKKKEI